MIAMLTIFRSLPLSQGRVKDLKKSINLLILFNFNLLQICLLLSLKLLSGQNDLKLA